MRNRAAATMYTVYLPRSRELIFYDSLHALHTSKNKQLHIVDTSENTEHQQIEFSI